MLMVAEEEGGGEGSGAYMEMMSGIKIAIIGFVLLNTVRSFSLIDSHSETQLIIFSELFF